MELYCKQDLIPALGGFPTESVTFEATRRVRSPPPLSRASACLSQYTLTESGSRRTPEAQGTSARPPSTLRTLLKSIGNVKIFHDQRWSRFQRKPFENWKFVTEILHATTITKFQNQFSQRVLNLFQHSKKIIPSQCCQKVQKCSLNRAKVKCAGCR